MPFTNFIILHKDKAPSEVLYGWSFSDVDIAPYVFLSRNEKLIEYFKQQFSALRSISTELKE
jgi:hypothetical protein